MPVVDHAARGRGGWRRARARRPAAARCSPTPADLALLQHAQELALQPTAAGRRSRRGRRVPPSRASRRRPARSRSAPVKAPRSWPKSSLRAGSRESAAQLTATKGPLARGLRAWSAAARRAPCRCRSRRGSAPAARWARAAGSARAPTARPGSRRRCPGARRSSRRRPSPAVRNALASDRARSDRRRRGEARRPPPPAR